MARQTRAQRRARRQAQADSRAQQQQTDGRGRQQAAAAVPQPSAAPSEEARSAEIVEHVPGRGFARFVHESWAELKKVDWPGQSQVIQATTVVLLACAIVGVYLWGADLVLKRLVEKIFLGQ